MDLRHPSSPRCVSGIATPGIACLLIAATAVAASDSAPAGLVQQFHVMEQALMDAVAVGDKAVWARAMDPSCIITSEEGQILTRDQFLNDLRQGRADRIVNVRKFEPLVWTRVDR